MNLISHFNLSTLNTLGLRAQAELYGEITREEDVLELLSQKKFSPQDFKILGGGSNLVMPAEVSGLTLRLANAGRALVQEDADAFYVRGAAGENWHEFVQWTLQHGFPGLENLSLIPGTLGAAPIQNIGAYGLEVKDLLHEVECIDLHTGQKRKFSNAECRFSYRESFFKQEGAGKYLVWTVTFRLPKKNQLRLEYGDIRKEVDRHTTTPTAQDVAQAVITIRQSKLPDPRVIGNAGSFFKNPVVRAEQRHDLLQSQPELVSFPFGSDFKLAAGWLIDRAGWKGKRLGPVGMYDKQALVLVNHGGATAADVWKLAQAVQNDVQARFGVHLEAEPVAW